MKGDCDQCGVVDVPIETSDKKNYCPYCYVSMEPSSSLSKTLANMFNVLEERLKNE